MARPADPHAKEALEAAARVEFLKKGLRGARVEDITAACRVSKGAFYLHFASKEALFAELVAGFEREMARAGEARMAAMRAFQAREGTLTSADIETHSPRMQRMIELELDQDLQALESMWEFRDVMSVLFTGVAGTEFEGKVWALVEAEEQRVARDFTELQGQGACRADIPPEVFGSMIVGTYVRVGQRMAAMQSKPDLRAWARSLHTLIREGSAPAPTARRVQSIGERPRKTLLARPSRRRREAR